MSRLRDAVVRKGIAYAKVPILNLAKGDQHGYMPKYGSIGPDGEHYEAFINNHAYVKRPVIPICVSYPLGYDYLPYKEYWVTAFKSLMETQALSIGGLNSNLVINYAEHPVHGSGEQQEEIVNVTRERSQIQYKWQERANKTISRFIEATVQYLYMDAETKIPRIRQHMEAEDYGFIYTPDYQSGAMLYIEPDIMARTAIDAWLCFNMKFKGAGNSREGGRDLTVDQEIPQLDIGITSITVATGVVQSFAQRILNEMTIFSKVPDEDLILPFNKIHPVIKEAPVGYDHV